MKALLALVVLFLSVTACPGQMRAMDFCASQDTIKVRVVLREEDTAHHRSEYQTPEYVQIPLNRAFLKQSFEGDPITLELLSNDSVLGYEFDYAKNIYSRIYRGTGHFHQLGGKTLVKDGSGVVKCPLRYRTRSPLHSKSYQHPLKPGYYTYRAILRNGVKERKVLAERWLVVKVNNR